MKCHTCGSDEHLKRSCPQGGGKGGKGGQAHWTSPTTYPSQSYSNSPSMSMLPSASSQSFPVMSGGYDGPPSSSGNTMAPGFQAPPVQPTQATMFMRGFHFAEAKHIERPDGTIFSYKPSFCLRSSDGKA